MMTTEQLPDPDSIKMFVGQLPKSWSENDVRQYFQEFGSIYLVNVLRDKITKQSRGCCFVTYLTRRSALEAQNALHNLKTLPGMNHPIQMKPADNENRAERKIFVGMINKKINEIDLRGLFCRFGLIEECSILRDANEQSRGCGFVTFSSKASALSAIKTMHHSTTMDGCSSPIVTKFADVQRDKVTKDAIALLTTLADSNSAQKSQYLPVLHLLQQGNCLAAQSGYSIQAASPPLQQMPQMHQTTPSTDLNMLTFLANLASSNAVSTISPVANQGNGLNMNARSITGFGGHNFPTQLEGPEGSNLFIYHLPQEFTDSDLYQSFLPFGSVLSSKVFLDKQTSLSKCFGFVSYDNAISAHLAIQTMNGFAIGPKRLKVQLKRAKDKPY